MKKFGAGIISALTFLAIAALIWLSLDEQAKGIVVGLLVGAAGMLCGITVALAIVALFLLAQMRWQVQGSPHQPPIVMGYPPAALPAPDHTVYPPPPKAAWDRLGRHFRILGEEDMPGEEYMPGTRPPGW